MRTMVRAAFAAFAVSTLALTAANTALAQQGDPPPRFEDQAEHDTERARHLERRIDRERDDFGGVTDRDSGPLCSDEDALSGRCMVVARLPRCPGDPRCPDPTRVRPDTETPQ